MTLPDLASVIAGSAILVGLFASIARKPKSIPAISRDWRKVQVAA